MAKCRGNCDIPVMGVGTASRNNKVYISVTDPIDACVNVNASTYFSVTGATSSFMKFDKPKDQLNCPEPLCITTGTLYLTQTEAETPSVVTFKRADATQDYVNGVFTDYLVFKDAGSYVVKTTIRPIDGGAEVVFTDNITVSASDPVPLTKLIQHGIAEADAVLAPTDSGLEIEVSILGDAGTTVGVSSLSLVQDKAAFEQSDTIMFTCIDEVDFPTEVDLTDVSCLGQAPDPSSVSTELSITAQQVTGNYLRLNPLLHKTDSTEAFDIDCLERTISPITINGEDKFGIRLKNFSTIECGFISAYLPACNATDGKLEYSTIKNSLDPDQYTFKIMLDEASGEYYAVFIPEYNGLVATITYPSVKKATIYEANDDFVEGRRIRVVVPFEFKNGYRGYYISRDAFVTSFPFGWSSTEDTPLEFTITFKNVGGKFYDLVLLNQENEQLASMI